MCLTVIFTAYWFMSTKDISLSSSLSPILFFLTWCLIHMQLAVRRLPSCRWSRSSSSSDDSRKECQDSELRGLVATLQQRHVQAQLTTHWMHVYTSTMCHQSYEDWVRIIWGSCEDHVKIMWWSCEDHVMIVIVVKVTWSNTTISLDIKHTWKIFLQESSGMLSVCQEQCRPDRDNTPPQSLPQSLENTRTHPDWLKWLLKGRWAHSHELWY